MTYWLYIKTITLSSRLLSLEKHLHCISLSCVLEESSVFQSCNFSFFTCNAFIFVFQSSNKYEQSIADPPNWPQDMHVSFIFRQCELTISNAVHSSKRPLMLLLILPAGFIMLTIAYQGKRWQQVHINAWISGLIQFYLEQVTIIWI